MSSRRITLDEREVLVLTSLLGYFLRHKATVMSTEHEQMLNLFKAEMSDLQHKIQGTSP